MVPKACLDASHQIQHSYLMSNYWKYRKFKKRSIKKCFFLWGCGMVFGSILSFQWNISPLTYYSFLNRILPVFWKKILNKKTIHMHAFYSNPQYTLLFYSNCPLYLLFPYKYCVLNTSSNKNLLQLHAIFVLICSLTYMHIIKASINLYYTI